MVAAHAFVDALALLRKHAADSDLRVISDGRDGAQQVACSEQEPSHAELPLEKACHRGLPGTAGPAEDDGP